MSYRLTITVFALFLFLPPLAAQQLLRSPFLADQELNEEMMTNPRLARARFEADQVDAASLARGRHAALQVVCQAHRMVYLDGRIPWYVVLERLPNQLQAELDAQGLDNPTAVLELTWRYAWERESFLRGRLSRGTANVADLAQARIMRLEIESALVRARRAHPEAQVDIGPDLVFEDDAFLEHHKSLARDRFQAEQTSQEERDRDRYDTARNEVEARKQELLAGRITTDVLLEACQDQFRAKRDLGGEANLLSALEILWQHARANESILQAKLDAGTAKVADLAQARAMRLEIESTLLRARRAHPEVQVSLGPDLVFEDDYLLEYNKKLARDRFQAEQTSQEERDRDLYDAARDEIEARMQELLAGRTITDVLLEAQQRFCKTQRDLGGEANLEPALELRWRLTWYTETVLQARLAAQTAKIVDTYWATATRFEVERQLARLKERSKP
jgi:hypothetical protein